MNLQQFTEKSRTALSDAQQISIEYQNQEVNQEHLAASLLKNNQGLIPQLLQKMSKDAGELQARISTLIDKIPKVTGTGREMDKIYIHNDLDRALTAAQDTARQMKDEFISVEHLFLGLLKKPSPVMKQLWRDTGIDEHAFLAALQTVRGNTRVTNDTPEDTYDVLAKYGQDLVELARNQKLDPVIGRDNEIRSVIRILTRKNQKQSRTDRRTGRR